MYMNKDTKETLAALLLLYVAGVGATVLILPWDQDRKSVV